MDQKTINLYQRIQRIRRKWKIHQHQTEELLKQFHDLHNPLDVLPDKNTGLDRGYGGNQSSNAIMKERIYTQLQESLNLFQEFMNDFLNIYCETENCGGKANNSSYSDFIQRIAIIIKMHELEFQHKEGILRSLKFDSPPDVAMTHVTSFSSEPFINKKVITEFSEVIN